MKSLSVIIPAYNDACRLESTLERLQAIKQQEYPALEIVVAVRPSHDDTLAVATAGADLVVPGGTVSMARNRGAEAATGEVFVFLDADTRPNFGTLPAIAAAVQEETIGSCSAYPNRSTANARLLTRLQNAARTTRMVKGMSNLLFCHRSLVHDQNIWFDETMQLGEHRDFFERACEAGARYRYLRLRRGYEVDVTRYERRGYWPTLAFWLHWNLRTRVLKADARELQELYWSLSVTAPTETKQRMTDGLREDIERTWAAFRERHPVTAAVLHFPASLSGISLGVLFLAAAAAGPRTFILNVFRDELAEDPAAPFVHFLLGTASVVEIQTIQLIGIAITAASLTYFLAQAKKTLERIRLAD